MDGGCVGANQLRTIVTVAEHCAWEMVIDAVLLGRANPDANMYDDPAVSGIRTLRCVLPTVPDVPTTSTAVPMRFGVAPMKTMGPICNKSSTANVAHALS